MKKIFITLIGIITMVVLLVSCAVAPAPAEEAISAEEDELQERPDPTPRPMSSVSPLSDTVQVQDTNAVRIGYSICYGQQEFAEVSARGFTEHSEGTGVSYEVMDAQGDVQQQLKDLAELVQQEYDAIAVYTTDSSAVLPALQKIADAGIPLITIGEIPGAKAHTVIDPGDYGLAYRTAGRMLDTMDEGQTVAIFVPTHLNARDAQRLEAYEYILAYTDTEAVTVQLETAEQAQAEAEKRMQQENGTVGSIWCLNGLLLEGAGRAAEKLQSDMPVGGIDYTPAVFSLLEAGWVDEMATELPYWQGELAAEVAAGLALGEYYPDTVDTLFDVYSTEDSPISHIEMQGTLVEED